MRSERHFARELYGAIASLQGWDAPMLYGYLQSPVQAPEKPDPWSTWNDPAITALMPAAAVLFRQGHVREARKTYRLDLSRDAVYYQSTSPQTSRAIRTLVEQSKLTIGLPDISEPARARGTSKGEDVIVFADPAREFLPAGQDFVASDTQELKRDWAHGIETSTHLAVNHIFCSQQLTFDQHDQNISAEFVGIDAQFVQASLARR